MFSSIEFLGFFAVLLIGYARVRSESMRRTTMMVANFVFYAWWDWRFCLLILVGALVDFRIAVRIADADTMRGQRGWLALSVLYNLGILVFFKYADFLVDNGSVLFGVVHKQRFNIVLPLGISFFTFQAMSYTLDVFRRQFPATRRFSDFAFSMTFFPHLIAGPIVRASHFMPQLDGPHPLTANNLRVGGSRFLRGFLKKVLFADTFAVCADHVFASPSSFAAASVWLGVAAYTAQIYFDFSGYSEMAIGLARVFGFEFPENFDRPYLATNITEFWRRWHMSLSTWLRDYLYISLGGNRRGRARTYLNLLATMLLGGLWHGASWTFVVWGGLHGIALAAHKAWGELLRGRRSSGLGARMAGWAFTLLFVMVCWVFFRASSTDAALIVLAKMAGLDAGGADWLHTQTLVLLGVVVLVYLIESMRPGFAKLDVGLPHHAVGAFAALLMALLFSPVGYAPFIYFQF